MKFNISYFDPELRSPTGWQTVVGNALAKMVINDFTPSR